MTVLDKQLDEIEQQVTLLAAGQDNRKVIDEMETACDELQPAIADLLSALKQRKTLCQSPTDFDLVAFTEKEAPLREDVEKRQLSLGKLWQAEPAAIRQKGNVSELRRTVDIYRQYVENNNASTWKAWLQHLERAFLIAGPQLESIKHVLDYAGAITRYKQGLERFTALCRSIPESEEVLTDIKSLASDLIKLKRSFVFDLPATVVKFYDALDRDGSFPLGELDPSVAAWLLDNGGLKDLAIVRRRMIR